MGCQFSLFLSSLPLLYLCCYSWLAPEQPWLCCWELTQAWELESQGIVSAATWPWESLFALQGFTFFTTVGNMARFFSNGRSPTSTCRSTPQLSDSWSLFILTLQEAALADEPQSTRKSIFLSQHKCWSEPDSVCLFTPLGKLFPFLLNYLIPRHCSAKFPSNTFCKVI